MGKYQSLKSLFHQAGADAQTIVQHQLETRRQSPAALHWPYRIGDRQIFAVLTTELQALVENIWRREIRVRKSWEQLPRAAQKQYLYSLLIQEMRSTNEIEGIHSTRQQINEAIVAAEKAPARRNVGHKRFAEMAKSYLILFGGAEAADLTFPKTFQDVRQLYDDLLGEEISATDAPDGEYFRQGPVIIEDGTRTIHEGIRGEEAITTRVQVMVDAQQEGKGNELVHALAGHFMFEHTHPFYDGNGRFGRYLLGLRLRGLLSVPTALSLSAELMASKNKYYKAFTDAEHPLNQGELTFFIMSMATFLNDAQEALYQALEGKRRRLERLQEALDELPRDEYGEYEIEALHLLGQVYLFGPRRGLKLVDIELFMGRSRNTVRPIMQQLEEKGLVDTLARRPLVFALSEEGLELLDLGENYLD